MKIKWNKMTIECTPDEFEDLFARGIFNQDMIISQDNALRDLYGLPKSSEPPKKETLRNPFPDVVAVYGCNVPANVGDDITCHVSTSLEDENV